MSDWAEALARSILENRFGLRPIEKAAPGWVEPLAAALRQAAAKGREQMRERAADFALTFETDAFNRTIGGSRDIGAIGFVGIHRKELSCLAEAIRALPTEDEPT